VSSDCLDDEVCRPVFKGVTLMNAHRVGMLLMS
jgi:hypothetical protein